MPSSQAWPMSHFETARKACHSCRVSKIPCGAARGTPCPNWNRQVPYNEINQRSSKRRRMNPKPSAMSPPVPERVWPLGVDMHNTHPLDLASQYVNFGDEYTIIASDPEAEWTRVTLDPAAPSQLSLDTQPVLNSTNDELWNTFTDFSSEGSSQGSPSSMLSPVSLLPDFVNSLPPTMDSATTEFLQLNGVFTLPSDSLQTALLQSFVECVLPSMPIVEWQDFLNSIYGHSGHSPISLLLFHAVMFSATTFVDLKHLIEAGYSNRREAHESFFQKTKLLYQACYEEDTLTIVQSMLLLTYRVDTKDGDDSSHWIGIAISMATSIGLLQDPNGTRNFNHSSRLWKRVAWACYTTDCLISLRLRCQPNIPGIGFCHQTLTEDDFELYSLTENNRILPPSCTVAYNVNVQRELARIYIASTRLCVCISEVLDFRGKANYLYAPASPTTSRNRDSLEKATRVSISEYKLADWADSLPSSCHAPSLDSSNIEDPTVAVQRSLLHLQFYTTIAILHQLQPFPSSKFCVQHAASQITLIASELYEKGLHDRLSIVGVTAILVALIIHMSQLKASPSSERYQAIKNFQACLDVMVSLRDVYWEAASITEWASKAIESVVFDGVFDFVD